VEEQQWVVGQVFQRDSDDVPRASEACMSVSHRPFGLEAPFP
jgi:hypothetical protein